MKLFHKNKIELTADQIKKRKRELLLGLLSGILLGLSYPPVPLPFLSFFALIPYLYVMEKRDSLLSLNRFTYFTLFIFNLITLYWVGSWTKESDTFLMISGAALLFFNPFFYLIVPTLYHFSRKAFGKLKALMLLPFYWVTFEYLYSITDARFPWLTLGNCLPYFNTFIQIADIVGVYGISLIILFVNIFIYLSIKNLKQNRKVDNRFAMAAVLLFFFVLVYGTIRINSFTLSEKKIKVGLIQPNLNPWNKWKDGNLDEQLTQYLSLSDKAVAQNAKLIVWPESALPVYLLSGNYDREVSRINEFVSLHNIFLMTGMPDINFYFNRKDAPVDAKETKSGTLYTSYNSILYFSPETDAVQKYGKIKLVPFGEHVPFVEEFPFLGDFIKWEVGISSWNVGKNQTVFNFNKNGISSVRAGGVICIESIYPEFVAGFVQRGADLIVVVTNDSWYGYSSGPFQHKEISVLRAVENRKSVVRTANGGVSCIIDPMGRTVASTKLFTKDILVNDAVIQEGMTFYSAYPFTIPYLASLISIVTILFFYFKKISNRISKKS
ncbi:MAG: apolipoprotein N-acyltransferase [Ignavibacteriae bacterium HGW-Ignavibacteriae-3]|nr:MAG: apolipoprotein N-acyltransferase [Ignavibacteriae bacterium HGW-Ignavibacteriae-3]